jgi:hypothetical protein
MDLTTDRRQVKSVKRVTFLTLGKDNSVNSGENQYQIYCFTIGRNYRLSRWLANVEHCYK